jgi:hypothetical protein
MLLLERQPEDPTHEKKRASLRGMIGELKNVWGTISPSVE